MYCDNMPINMQDADKVVEYTEKQLELIELAEQCGLTASGLDYDGRVQFAGEDEDWKNFEEKQDELGIYNESNFVPDFQDE